MGSSPGKPGVVRALSGRWWGAELTINLVCHNVQTFIPTERDDMISQTFSSRDFTRDVSAAKRAAADGPVLITDRGRPAFALLKIDDYYRLTGRGEKTLLDVMDGIPGGDGIEFDPPRLDLQIGAAEFDLAG